MGAGRDTDNMTECCVLIRSHACYLASNEQTLIVLFGLCNQHIRVWITRINFIDREHVGHRKTPGGIGRYRDRTCDFPLVRRTF